jgi:hypothetical protein
MGIGVAERRFLSRINYEPPAKIQETLIANLLPIAHMPEWFYLAPTEHRTRPSVFKRRADYGE